MAHALAAQLQSQGHTCTVASPDDHQDLKFYASCANFVHLSSLDLCDLAARPDAILEAQKHWIETMQFIQALLREANGSKRRLWIVTRGAQAAGPAPAHISLAQTPLWGLAKTIDLEHAELGCTRIDLDPEGSAEATCTRAVRGIVAPCNGT